MPPIPKRALRPWAILCGDADAAVTLEVHLDLQCPFSRKSWNNVKQLKDRFTAKQLRVIFSPFALFTHQWAWNVHRAATAVGLQAPDKYFDFIDHAFANQEAYQHAAGREHTPKDVEGTLAGWGSEICSVDAEAFAAVMGGDDAVLAAKEAQRRGISRGVWSTPTFFVNDNEASSMGSGKSPDDWAEFLTPLIGDDAGGAGGSA